IYLRHHPRANHRPHFAHRPHSHHSRFGGHVPCRDLRNHQSADADEPHFQRNVRRFRSSDLREGCLRAGSGGMKDNTFNEAKQLYLEQSSSAIFTGGYLKIAVALLSLVVLGLVVMNLKIVRTLESFKPLVIRIDEIGRAQAVAYESLAYKPEYKE